MYACSVTSLDFAGTGNPLMAWIQLQVDNEHGQAIVGSSLTLPGSKAHCLGPVFRLPYATWTEVKHGSDK